MNINIIVMIIIMHYYTCISAHEYRVTKLIVNPLYYYSIKLRRSAAKTGVKTDPGVFWPANTRARLTNE